MKKKILIVDDNIEARLLIETILRGSGYTAVSAANGAEAMETLQKETFHLVISDILMPVMDGFQLCRECKASDKLGHLPFIFYTAAYTDKKDEDLALKLGADRFLRKPMEPADLIQTIQALLKDTEKSKLKPDSPPDLMDKEEVSKLYSERLVNKLEKKTLALKAEISERQRVEKALRISEEKYRAIAETVPVAVTVSDLEGTLTYASPQTADLHGYDSPGELLGKNALELIAPEEHEKALANLKETLQEGIIKSLVYTFLKKDGARFTGELSAALLKDAGGEPEAFIAITQDITERKRAEEALKASLLEKEVLLKEVHHRVKNNLQIISSLINLQAAQLNDQESKHIFQEIKNRIYSMALVHKKLYQSRDFSNINFREYVEEMVNELLRTYQTTVHVSPEIEISDIAFDIDTAIPCGLILNELISNALKHAFPHCQQGNIYISIQPLEAPFYELTVRDNGVGIPRHFSLEKTDSLGIRLVKMLADQLEGSITITGDKGTTIKIKFPQK
jgi:PAS domain S-box-containing protein